MKKFYESPSAEIEKFIVDNVIITSGGGIEQGGEEVGVDLHEF